MQQSSRLVERRVVARFRQSVGYYVIYFEISHGTNSQEKLGRLLNPAGRAEGREECRWHRGVERTVDNMGD